MNSTTAVFSDQLLIWFDQHGRKNLPWQTPTTPYRTWVSEIMLQQTQVETVIPYFERFLSAFPDIKKLACAPQDEVLHLWTGLGYYARARNLHACAKTVVEQYNGHFPSTLEELQALPGIGPSTAAAIASIAFGQPTAILDGNVKRVLARYFAVEGWPGRKPVEQALWAHAHSLMPNNRCKDYTQAIMDLGATLCTRSKPQCPSCPVSQQCEAFKKGNPTDYPGKKPKKIIPVKTTNMLILRNANGDILLQKRPPQGIWGGLWSLPEASQEQDMQTFCLNTFNKKIPTVSFAKMRHTFSHYHLDIHAHVAQLIHRQPKIMDSNHLIWYNLSQPQNVGLAAPVKKLLVSLQQTSKQQLDTL